MIDGIIEGLDQSHRASAYRPEIDGLRALAVLAVVIFHAFPSVLPGGFVGVDVFFVISGFLISGIIRRAVDDRAFSLLDFYARRLRRILPALLVVLVACLLAGYAFWLADEWQALGRHTFAGALFHANVALANEPGGGYFVALSRSTPLLHLWSLGVEEQFYLVWPLLFAALVRWTRWPLAGVAVLLVASFVLNLAWLPDAPADTYYLPFTRLWELLVGAALVGLRQPLGRGLAEASALTGLGLIAIACVAIDAASPFPGWWAWLPTLGAALVIAAGNEAAVNRVGLAARPVVWVGLISYPLYLWHWPMLVFGRALWIDAQLWPGALLLVLASVALAVLTWRAVEGRLRRGRGALAPVLMLVALCVVAYAGDRVSSGDVRSRLTRIVPSAPVLISASHDWAYPFPANFRKTGAFAAGEENPGRDRAVLFIGDSYLEQYWPRVHHVVSAAPDTMPTVQFFTRGSCAPLRHEESRGPVCGDFLNAALAAANAPRVETVVLGGFWEAYFDTGRVGEAGVRPLIELDSDTERRVLGRFGAMIRDLRGAGKRVFVIRSGPTDYAFDPRHLVSRLTGARRDAPVPVAPWQRQIGPLLARLSAVATAAGAVVLDPVPSVCDAGACPVSGAGGEPTHTDRGHMRPWFIIERATFLDRVLMSAPLPAERREAGHTPATNRQALGRQQRGLHLRVAAEPSDAPARRNDPVIRQPGFVGAAHDLSHRARGSRPARKSRHIAVGDNAPGWNAPQDMQHPSREHGHTYRTTASVSTWPSTLAMVMPTRWARVGAMSAGVAGTRYRPGLIPAPAKMTGTRWSYA